MTYRQAWFDNDKEPSGYDDFKGEYWSTTFGQQIGASKSQSAKLGESEQRKYSADGSGSVFEFPVDSGLIFECFTVRSVGTFTASQNKGVLVQNQSRNNWGGWLAPGAYSSIVSTNIRQGCAAIPPTATGVTVAGGAPVALIGGTGNTTNTTGRLASR